jgi:hypothetical protein
MGTMRATVSGAGSEGRGCWKGFGNQNRSVATTAKEQTMATAWVAWKERRRDRSSSAI